MIRRIDPNNNSLRVSVSDIQYKTLHSLEAIDPSLSKAQIAELQAKLANHDKTAATLKKALEQIHQSYLEDISLEEEASPTEPSTVPVTTRSDFLKNLKYKTQNTKK